MPGYIQAGERQLIGNCRVQGITCTYKKIVIHYQHAGKLETHSWYVHIGYITIKVQSNLDAFHCSKTNPSLFGKKVFYLPTRKTAAHSLYITRHFITSKHESKLYACRYLETNLSLFRNTN